MHGIGNDFVLVKASDLPAESEWPALAQRLCDRRFGIGSDGLLIADHTPEGVLQMRMLNPDGSESEMCGNGIRCFALYARDQGLTASDVIPVMTGAGLLELHIQPDQRVRVDMGLARLTRGEIGMTGTPDELFIGQTVTAAGHSFKATAISMGNPHLVMPVPEVAAIPLTELGPAFENHPLFPRRVNAHWIEVLSRDRIRQRTWERGAGVTLACGTGACACAVAAYLNELTERVVTVELPGGNLTIEYAEGGRVFMTGPAETVFTGTA